MSEQRLEDALGMCKSLSAEVIRLKAQSLMLALENDTLHTRFLRRRHTTVGLSNDDMKGPLVSKRKLSSQVTLDIFEDDSDHEMSDGNEDDLIIGDGENKPMGDEDNDRNNMAGDGKPHIVGSDDNNNTEMIIPSAQPECEAGKTVTDHGNDLPTETSKSNDRGIDQSKTSDPNGEEPDLHSGTSVPESEGTDILLAPCEPNEEAKRPLEEMEMDMETIIDSAAPSSLLRVEEPLYGQSFGEDINTLSEILQKCAESTDMKDDSTQVSAVEEVWQDIETSSLGNAKEDLDNNQDIYEEQVLCSEEIATNAETRHFNPEGDSEIGFFNNPMYRDFQELYRVIVLILLGILIGKFII